MSRLRNLGDWTREEVWQGCVSSKAIDGRNFIAVLIRYART
jgi:hypothetical protein